MMLNAPSFEVVLDWRTEQECKLAERIASEGKDPSDLSIMSAEEIALFLMHYERITRHTLRQLPSQADIRIDFDADRNVRNLTVNEMAFCDPVDMTSC